MAASLRGSKVSLDAFGIDDVRDEYIGWLNDPAVVRYSNQRFVRHDRATCLRYLASFEGTDNAFFAVRRIDDRRTIGTMTMYRSVPHGTADIGIMIGDTSAWGHGYGQDAWDTLVRWGLETLRLRKLTAGALACNAAMVRVIERSGMRLEAVRKAQKLVDGRPEDILYFARFGDS